MKTVCLVLLCILSFSHSIARIRNGYESRLQRVKQSLRELNSLMAHAKDKSLIQRLRIKTEIDNLINYISCYELTKELIYQFKLISPQIYLEMENIKDKRGRPTDIFVKLIQKEKSKMHLKAASFFSRIGSDEDANHSEYGEFSVSVEIWIDDNALVLLSHEFGHISYVVPNLATYAKFYKKEYSQLKAAGVGYMGHKRYDLSGKFAKVFEKRHLEDRAIYLQNGGRKPEPFIAFFTRTRKAIRNSEPSHPTSVIVSNF